MHHDLVVTGAATGERGRAEPYGRWLQTRRDQFEERGAASKGRISGYNGHVPFLTQTTAVNNADFAQWEFETRDSGADVAPRRRPQSAKARLGSASSAGGAAVQRRARPQSARPSGQQSARSSGQQSARSSQYQPMRVMGYEGFVPGLRETYAVVNAEYACAEYDSRVRSKRTVVPAAVAVEEEVVDLDSEVGAGQGGLDAAALAYSARQAKIQENPMTLLASYRSGGYGDSMRLANNAHLPVVYRDERWRPDARRTTDAYASRAGEAPPLTMLDAWGRSGGASSTTYSFGAMPTRTTRTTRRSYSKPRPSAAAAAWAKTTAESSKPSKKEQEAQALQEQAQAQAQGQSQFGDSMDRIEEYLSHYRSPSFAGHIPRKAFASGH